MEELTKKLYDEVFENGGLTLDKEYKKISQKDGYMCSILGYEIKIALEDCNFEEVKEIATNYQKILKNNLYLGFWIEKGFLYIDISKWYTKRSDALKAGKINKQISVYDIARDDYIKVVYDTFYYIIDTKTTLNVGTFSSLEDIKKSFNLKNSVKSLYINNVKGSKLLLDRYEVYKENLYYDDVKGLLF